MKTYICYDPATGIIYKAFNNIDDAYEYADRFALRVKVGETVI